MYPYRAKQPGDMSAAWLLLPLALLMMAVVAMQHGVDVALFLDSTLPNAILVFAVIATVIRLLWWIGALIWGLLTPR